MYMKKIVCSCMAMKKILVLGIMLLMYSCAYHPKIVPLPHIPEKLAQTMANTPHQALIVGEVLSYTVDWHGIPAGELTLKVIERTRVGDRECYRVSAAAKPYKIFTIFFNVRYEIETYIDSQTYVPLKYIKKKIEGKKISVETLTYDPQRHTILWENTGQAPKTICDVKDLQNLASFIYYFRTRSVAQGGECRMNVLHKGKPWPMQLRVRCFESLHLKRAGKIKTFVVEMSTQLTENAAGSRDATIYFSADERRIPLVFKIKARMGLLTGVIRNLPK